MPQYELLTIDEARRELRIGRTLFYDLINEGAIRTIAIGRTRRIARKDLLAYIERLREGAVNE